MKYTVMVFDEQGRVVYASNPLDPKDAGSNAEHARVGYPDTRAVNDVEKVLHMAGPDVCPFDCDYCRS